MHIAFLLTQPEISQARRLLYRQLRSRGERLTDYAYLAMSVALFVPTVLLVSRGQVRHWEDFYSPLLPLVFLLMAAQTWRQHHQFANEADYSEDQTLEVREDGIFRTTAQCKAVTVSWGKISQYTESADMFVLASPWPRGVATEAKTRWRDTWLPKPVLIILPKRAFGPNDIEQFRNLLDRKLSIWAKQRSLSAIPQHS